jgi:hypothetical protein
MAALVCSTHAVAAPLERDDFALYLGNSYSVGEVMPDMPVYPVFNSPAPSSADKPALVGYVFQTADFAAVRGFSGKSMNLLVLLSPDGTFVDAQLIQHQEPLFARPGKTAALETFTEQFKALSLKHRIEIGHWTEDGAVSADKARLQGVHMGTITIKAITENIVASAATVAAAQFANTNTTFAASGDNRLAWLTQWRTRSMDILVLALGLGLLTLALLRQHWLSQSTRRLRLLRTLYLLFTLGFVGWHAQAQLTIVNVTAAIEATKAGDNWAFFLSDPITSILWVFVGITLLVWGRATFCGWLCPFGALQELVSMVTSALGLRQHRLKTQWDLRLKRLKYAVLGAIVATVLWAPAYSDWAVEVEPFKTAISLFFVREWPAVAWAVFCVGLSTVVYRGYCRYICPLGAALAVGGLLRRWRWIPRRDACGTPCQTCRHRCEYQAIAPSGEVQYQECFQCLDCVAIHQDTQRCYPLIIANKDVPRVITIHPVGPQ